MDNFKKIIGRVPIEAAPDEWISFQLLIFLSNWRLNNISVLQIKPVNNGIQLPEIFKEYALQVETHIKILH